MELRKSNKVRERERTKATVTPTGSKRERERGGRLLVGVSGLT